MRAVLELSAEQLQTWFTERGLPAYRARLVRSWLLHHQVQAFADMTDLPRALRGQLADSFRLWATEVVACQSAGDGTEKLLLQLADGERIECVLLRDDKGHRTACVSTQVGCGMGCVFCASGLDGLVRNLTSAEILEQMLRIQQRLPPGQSLTHVVVMGMGEPLANLEGLLPALATATSPEGPGISVRRVTISTVGLPQAIQRLAEQGCPYHLAVSLHAPDDRLRSQIVPAARRVPIASLLAAAEYYFRVTGRRITYEYVLLAGMNDQPRHARQLARLIRGPGCLVNLIPYNPVAGLPFRTPPARAVSRFAELLRQGGISVKIRYRKGDRIDAACGQLRRQAADARP
ncbi:MAG TPA: 23S rRNA (adenine(2503)-C(2))-methyltransferase RlmN [Planctomycetaceae bacterium]|nr:23S rRNA (adenine(2503)-C(2))-methyltransferase RlmN [Planctomycetaceae bacterium]